MDIGKVYLVKCTGIIWI